MANGFTVQYDQDWFRIIGPGGEEGEVAPMGSAAVLDIRGRTYGCVLDIEVDKDETPSTQAGDPDRVDPGVFLMGPPQVTAYREVDFDIPEEEDEDEAEAPEDEAPEDEVPEDEAPESEDEDEETK